ncbi:hypothetical protein B0H19DRAFT_1058600 [Mycena capillaripes]|nr:hypothetical protein B0H19DRAFT_1058600 [Mycena capillaripes]
MKEISLVQRRSERGKILKMGWKYNAVVPVCMGWKRSTRSNHTGSNGRNKWVTEAIRASGEESNTSRRERRWGERKKDVYSGDKHQNKPSSRTRTLGESHSKVGFRAARYSSTRESSFEILLYYEKTTSDADDRLALVPRARASLPVAQASTRVRAPEMYDDLQDADGEYEQDEHDDEIDDETLEAIAMCTMLIMQQQTVAVMMILMLLRQHGRI